MKRNAQAESLIPELAEFADALEAFEREFGITHEIVTTYEIDATCPLCGRREIRATRDPNAPGAVMAVCAKCSER